ncbi:MAG: putative transporter [Bacteroidales bacterium]|nr:putative transporter [Bacteroidales bacterium]
MYDLFFSSGTGHSLMVLSLVIGLGLILGKIKIKGFSLGPIWVLFVGILVSALGVKADSLFLHFLKEFGLILFVFIIGFQVGPGFFSSFRKDGLKMNLMSLLLVGLVVAATLLLWQLSSESLPKLVGTMSGAVTNTPGMGTAQQTWYDTEFGSFLAEVEQPQTASEIANAFAIAYPIGLLVTVLVIVLLRWLFRVKPEEEIRALEGGPSAETVSSVVFEVVNPGVIGKRVSEVLSRFEGDFSVTGIVRGKETFPVADDPVLEKGDAVHIDLTESGRKVMRLCFGRELSVVTEETEPLQGRIFTRKLMVTKSSLTGKKIKDLNLEKEYGVSVVRILRSGVELVARPEIYLQMGDGLRVAGDEKGITKVAELVGNKSSDLDKPNLIPVFIGIGLGLILGAVPIKLAGFNHAVHFGLAAGPLIMGILIGHFGPKWKITTYTSASALRMIREIGLCLLLATVGLGAGATFPQTFVESGWQILLFSAVIVFVPLLLTSLVARYLLHQDFFTICGLISGASTNPVALDFVHQKYGTEAASVAYALVYPFALFLQVLSAQLLVLLAV